MVLAVLEAHAGVGWASMMSISMSPAACGSRAGRRSGRGGGAGVVATGALLPADSVFFGEIGLSGAVRPVAHAGQRLKEAAKLGFTAAVTPQSPAEASAQDKADAPRDMNARPCAHISALVGRHRRRRGARGPRADARGAARCGGDAAVRLGL
jgi:DNA repair protein RadA/Sms